MKIARRAGNIAPAMTLKIFDEARSMRRRGLDIISFAAGEPDASTPEPVKAAAIEWIKKDFTKYVESSGIPELKAAVCRKLQEENGVGYTPAEILVGNGAKQLLFEACGALIDPGDEVIVPMPCWVSYVEQIKFFGGIPVGVKTREEDHFRLRAEDVAAAVTEKTKAILLNSPNNPSGAVIPAGELEKIAETAVACGLFVISDEVYEKFAYTDEPVVSIASLGPDIRALAVTVNSLSKSYCMTGWRVGYAAAARPVIDAMAAVHSHVTGNVSSFTQKAAITALGSFHAFAPMRDAYKERRDDIVRRLNAMPGVRCHAPDGAFYAFPNVQGLLKRAYAGKEIRTAPGLAEFLLSQAQVACVPGEAFGMAGHLRFTFAIDPERIKEGMDRMEKAVRLL